MPFKSKAQLALEAAEQPLEPALTHAVHKTCKVLELRTAQEAEQQINALFEQDYEFLFAVESATPHISAYVVLVKYS